MNRSWIRHCSWIGCDGCWLWRGNRSSAQCPNLDSYDDDLQ